MSAEKDISLDEKRVYDGDERKATLYVASGVGCVAVDVVDERVGGFELVARGTARDVAAGGGVVAVATAEDVLVGRGTEIKGDVTTRSGSVEIGPGVTVWGDVVAHDVALHENATVDGTIRATGEMRMHTDAVLDRPDETAEAMAAAAEELEDGDGAKDGDKSEMQSDESGDGAGDEAETSASESDETVEASD